MEQSIYVSLMADEWKPRGLRRGNATFSKGENENEQWVMVVEKITRTTKVVPLTKDQGIGMEELPNVEID